MRDSICLVFTDGWTRSFSSDRKAFSLCFLSLLFHKTCKTSFCGLPFISSLSSYHELRFFVFAQLCRPISLAMSTSSKFVFGAELGHIYADCGPTSGKPVYLFLNVNEDAITAGSFTLSDKGTPEYRSLRRSMHNHDPPCDGELHSRLCSRSLPTNNSRHSLIFITSIQPMMFQKP